jgi:hypothetical protein
MMAISGKRTGPRPQGLSQPSCYQTDMNTRRRLASNLSATGLAEAQGLEALGTKICASRLRRESPVRCCSRLSRASTTGKRGSARSQQHGES